MKRFYLTITLLLFFCGATLSQEQELKVLRQTQRQERKQVREQLQEQWKLLWKTQRPRHELHFGIGDAMYRYINHYDEYTSYFRVQYMDRNWFEEDVFTKREIYTPVISVAYHYRLLRWLHLGGYVSYAGIFSERMEVITEKSTSFQNHFFTIAPSIRFSYFDRKYISLYSGLAVCVTNQFSKSKEYNSLLTDTFVEAQFTAFGISAGNKWFGFAELGFGNKGIISAGFGYRFNSKNIGR